MNAVTMATAPRFDCQMLMDPVKCKKLFFLQNI